MQFQDQKDFWIRPATASDRAEVLGLAPELEGGFSSYLSNDECLFDVVLSSNGVLIGVFLCVGDEWRVLAMNPNFLKKTVRAAVMNALRDWAEKKTQGRLVLQPRVIVGDWKTFLKSQGVRFETRPDGTDEIEFRTL